MNSTRPESGRLRLDPASYETLGQQVLRRDGWRCQLLRCDVKLGGSPKRIPQPFRGRFRARPDNTLLHVPRIRSRPEGIKGSMGRFRLNRQRYSLREKSLPIVRPLLVEAPYDRRAIISSRNRVSELVGLAATY